jgi:hypothetical protein
VLTQHDERVAVNEGMPRVLLVKFLGFESQQRF